MKIKLKEFRKKSRINEYDRAILELSYLKEEETQVKDGKPKNKLKDIPGMFVELDDR